MEFGAGRKRSAVEIGPIDDKGKKDIMTITPLGAGNEVGRSCIVLEYRDKKIMLDCGIHPAYTGMRGLPFFDTIDLSTIDLLLVTHFHLDHCAALPHLYKSTNFKGRVFMTHPTRAIYKLMLSDYVKVHFLLSSFKCFLINLLIGQ
jgi:cleavage and polyadenylation specificity factor subunit 3